MLYFVSLRHLRLHRGMETLNLVFCTFPGLVCDIRVLVCMYTFCADDVVRIWHDAWTYKYYSSVVRANACCCVVDVRTWIRTHNTWRLSTVTSTYSRLNGNVDVPSSQRTCDGSCYRGFGPSPVKDVDVQRARSLCLVEVFHVHHTIF